MGWCNHPSKHLCKAAESYLKDREWSKKGRHSRLGPAAIGAQCPGATTHAPNWRDPMRKLISLLVAGVYTFTLGACSEQPISPEQQEDIRSDHGATEVTQASGTYRTVDTKAAEKNGFSRAGERIGTLNVADDGSTLKVYGSASGLADADDRYVSLFYDKASPAQGPEACEPGVGTAPDSDHPLALTIFQMIIGPGSNTVDVLGLPHAAWEVDANGDATLGPAGTLEYVPADMIGTVSIRDLTVEGPIGPGTGPEAVVACAKITHDRAN